MLDQERREGVPLRLNDLLPTDSAPLDRRVASIYHRI